MKPSPRAGALVPRPRDSAPAWAVERPAERGSLCQLTSDSGHSAVYNVYGLSEGRAKVP